MKIAITGGIGSGKSYICKELVRRRISVYDCDEAAKRLMHTSPDLQQGLIELVGKNVYINKVLRKDVLSKFLLTDTKNKQALNNLVHPAVAQDFEHSGKDWLESAILFESGFYLRTHFDRVVCITAPLEVRIARIMARDGISRNQALMWIGSQWPQEKVIEHSNFIINNDGASDLSLAIDTLINKLNISKH